MSLWQQYLRPQSLADALDALSALGDSGGAVAVVAGGTDLLLDLDQEVEVRTDPNVSPTGYPFKVVQLEGTMTDPEVEHSRISLCDVGCYEIPTKARMGRLGTVVRPNP